MGTEEVVSIIVPAYNHEKYIIDALSSIACQTYYNKQLIVIDDCSKDRTAQLIEKYLDREIISEVFPAGITYIRHLENQNAHKTINEGISLASGKYISIINTDDCYETNRLEIMVEELENHKSRFAFSSVRCIDGDGNYIEYKPFEIMKARLKKYPSPVFELVIENAAIGTGNFIFERELYKEVGGFCSKYHFIHDWDFILKATLVCEPVYVEGTSYLYRLHDTNTIKQIDEKYENELKKDKEVEMVITNFLGSVLNGEVENPLLKDLDMWDYFFNLIPTNYCSCLWKRLKERKKHGVQCRLERWT